MGKVHYGPTGWDCMPGWGSGACNAGYYVEVSVTTDPDKVTCERCKKTKAYRTVVKEVKDG